MGRFNQSHVQDARQKIEMSKTARAVAQKLLKLRSTKSVFNTQSRRANLFKNPNDARSSINNNRIKNHLQNNIFMKNRLMQNNNFNRFKPSQNNIDHNSQAGKPKFINLVVNVVPPKNNSQVS